MFGRDDSWDSTDIRQDPSELVAKINLLSITIYKILGINVDKQIRNVQSGDYKYFTPSFNSKDQISLPLKTYIGLDPSIRKILRNADIVAVSIDGENIIDLIDEIEDVRNDKND